MQAPTSNNISFSACQLTVFDEVGMDIKSVDRNEGQRLKDNFGFWLRHHIREFPEMKKPLLAIVWQIWTSETLVHITSFYGYKRKGLQDSIQMWLSNSPGHLWQTQRIINKPDAK